MAIQFVGGTTTTYTDPTVTTTTTGTTTTTTTDTTTSTPFSSDSFTLGTVGSVVAKAGGAGAGAFVSGAAVGASMRTTATAVKANGLLAVGKNLAAVGGGFRAALPAIGKGLGIGVVVNAGVSGIINGIGVLTNKITGKEALGNVVADTVTGVGTSALAIGAGGLVMAAAAALPFAPILAVGAGIAAAVGGDFLFKKTGLWDKIKSMVTG